MRHIDLDAAGVILRLQVPVSARRANEAFSAWSAAQAAFRDAVLSESPDPATLAGLAEGADLAACEVAVRLASPDPACPPLVAYADGTYAHAREPGGPAPAAAAAADLLTWLEERGVYMADVGEALQRVRRSIGQPSAALVEEARGN